MQLKKEVKTNIYVAIVTMVLSLAIFLLIQNIASPTYNNVIGQIPMQQPVVEQAPPATLVAETGVKTQNTEALQPSAVQQSTVGQEQPTDSNIEATDTETVNNDKPAVIIVLVVGAIIIGVGICFLLMYLKRRLNNRETDDLEAVGEIQDDIEDMDQTLHEEIDQFDNDNTVFFDEEEASGFDEALDVGGDFDFDYSEYKIVQQDETDQGDTTGSGDVDELELCREIERLTDTVNDYAEKMKKYADNIGLTIPQELVAFEESDEMPAGAGELQQEVTRLKNRINAQIDYIEDIQKNQGAKEEKADNNNNKEPFLVCVANALSNMQQHDLVCKPERQRGNQAITYVPCAEFFGVLSKTMPDFKKKNVVEALKQHGIIENSEKGYDTVYKGKRSLKLNSEQFILLTTEFAEDVGA